MTKILKILLFVLTINAFGQEVNYEIKAIEYFISNVESDTIFHQACDCVYYDYDTKKTLVIYDSSYSEIQQKMALTAFQFELVDSLLSTDLKTKKIQIQNVSQNNRINLTKNSNDFNSNHYLIRFSDRLQFKSWTIIEFNIKSEKRCSGINYFFLFNETEQIEKYKLTILCDSPG